MSDQLAYSDVTDAAVRIAGTVRPLAVADAGPQPTPSGGRYRLFFALEQLQHTGTFKPRGAQNFLRAHMEAGALPPEGVTIASGGNAGMACAWAARQEGVRATVFVPASIPNVKVALLRGYGADVRLVDGPMSNAWDACEEFAAGSGALRSHAYDDPHIAAGAGTLMLEACERMPGLDTVVVAVGGGGLLSGVATVAQRRAIRVVAVEPEGAPTLRAALDANRPVDITPDSVAADSLGGKRVSAMGLAAARVSDVRSVLVPDVSIVAARQSLWDRHRLVVEHAAGAALAGLNGFAAEGAVGDGIGGIGGAAGSAGGVYSPADGETVCVVLCGANTDPSDLV